MNMKKLMPATVVIAALLAVAVTAYAVGPLSVETKSGTNTLTWTYQGTGGCYVERVDFRCLGVNTGTVTVVNSTLNVTNTITTVESTNGIGQYIVAEPVYRMVKGDSVKIDFTVMNESLTNQAAIYPFAK